MVRDRAKMNLAGHRSCPETLRKLFRALASTSKVIEHPVQGAW